MTCAEFERWLDEELPEASGAEARAHAASCEPCAASLAAAEAIEAGLARATFAAPAGLTGSVMARVAAIESLRAAPAATRSGQDAFPWWVRAAGDPAAIAATALCALLSWKWDAIADAGIAAAAWLASTNAGAGASFPASGWIPAGLGAQIALAVVLIPAALWLGRASFRMSERWMERAAGMRI